MIINLIRHGEIEKKNTYCGITDMALTEEGWQNMYEACDEMQFWDRIISSPLKRCLKFGEFLSQKLHLPLKIDKRWQEMNFGDWDGLTTSEIMTFDENRLQKFWQNPLLHHAPGGESLMSVQSRVLQAWCELSSEYSSCKTLIITHGGPMRIVHCHATGFSIERLMEINIPYAKMSSYPSISQNDQYAK